MKRNVLNTTINKPIEAVFEFTTNPKNTPLWLESVKVEKTNEWPVKLGTIYRNRGNGGQWNEYIVTALEPDQVFELTSSDKNYHVRYTYHVSDDNSCRLTYDEWTDKGELSDPFNQATLDKLKKICEHE